MSWKGYYVQCNQQHTMNLGAVNIIPGPGAIISGEGEDTVGKFSVSGSFSPNEPVCRFVKQYHGQHAVYY